MNKQQFDDAIGVVPPSTVDVDAIIIRQRRAAMVRRVAAPGVAAAAGVVAVTFGIAIALPGAPDQSRGTVPASQPAASSAPTSTRPSAAPLPCEGAAEDVPTAGARLSSALTAAVQRQIPDVELTANPTVDFGEGRRFGPLEFFLVGNDSEYDFNGDCMDPDGYFMAKANMSDADGVGNIGAFIGTVASHEAPQCAGQQVQPQVSSCTAGTGPNGETYVVTITGEEGATSYRVDFAKPDGTSGFLTTENVGGDIKLGRPAERPQPPLTIEQLVAIALDPNLTLFPPS